MAPFVAYHPALIDRWIDARETALQRVRSQAAATEATQQAFLGFLGRAQALVAHWQVEDAVQAARIAELRCDLDKLALTMPFFDWHDDYPWDRLFCWASSELCLEAQEMLVSLLLEPQGALIDDLADQMSVDETVEFPIDGAMSVARCRQLIEDVYAFALRQDYAITAAQARFWYVSEEKLEPRLGERFEEPGAELEQPLGIARDVAALHQALANYPADSSLADFLSQEPDRRHVVRRVQIAARHPYAEVRDNFLAAEMRPIDLLRCKLSFFGAMRFDPRSDRWVRITLFQHAPLPAEIDPRSADDWAPPAATVWD
jgi:hypothetical protein